MRYSSGLSYIICGATTDRWAVLFQGKPGWKAQDLLSARNDPIILQEPFP